jgi:hypothetical protein
MGKSTINGPFPMAMLNHQRVRSRTKDSAIFQQPMGSSQIEITPAYTSQIIGRKTWPRHPRATQRIPWPALHVLGLRVQWGWADWKAVTEIPHVTSHFEVQLLSTASTIKIVCLPVGSQVFFLGSNLSTCKLECFEMSGPRLIRCAGHWSHWHCSSEIFRIWT